jgi:hypothetical protein
MKPWERDPPVERLFLVQHYLVLVESSDGKKKKTKKPLLYMCTIDRSPETGCLECTIKFTLPYVHDFKLDDNLRYCLTPKGKKTFNARLHIPKRKDKDYTFKFSCDRLGKDYWPIQDEYQKQLKLDESLYKPMKFVEEECHKLINHLHEMIQDRWEFIQY